METIIASLITGIFGFIIAMVGFRGKFSKIQDSLDRKERADEKAVDSAQTTRKSEHSGLSNEHREISRDIHAIREAQIEDITGRKVRYDQLDNAQQLLVGSASTIGKFADEFARLVAENNALRSEVQQLRSENALLRADLEPEDDGPEFE